MLIDDRDVALTKLLAMLKYLQKCERLGIEPDVAPLRVIILADHDQIKQMIDTMKHPN